MFDEKCNSKADEFRDEGNAHFRNGEFQQALVCYNRSACYAELGSRQLSLAYANRSAVYMQATMYRKCLENVQMSRDEGNRDDKLDEREEKCKRLMKVEKSNPNRDPWDFFKLSHPSNERIPFIVDCLELRQDDKFGRYVVTSCELRPGDVIAIEEPFYKFIDKEQRYSRCSNCLKSNDLSLIPCTQCTSTMYCSPECKFQHEKFIHTVECRKKPLPSVLIVCTKMLLTAVSIAGSLSKLRSLLSDSSIRTVFDCDLRAESDAERAEKLLLVVNSMAKSEHSRIVINEKMKATFNHPPFSALWETDDEREYLVECFHNQLRIHNTNQLEMGEHTLEVAPDKAYWYVKTIGSGLCPFASLFNHSCDANVKRTCIDNRIAFVVAQPVAAGEQLFLSYGYSSYRLPRQERQNLLERFSFSCDCRACLDDYPELSSLPRIGGDFDEPSFREFSVDEAMEEYKNNCKYIETNIKHHPSYETTTILIHNDHLLHQISKGGFS